MEYLSPPHFLLVAVKYVAAGGGVYLIKFISLFFLYITVRYLAIKIKKSPKKYQLGSDYEKAFRSSLIMVGVLLAALFLLGIVVDTTNRSPAPVEVIRNSFSLMELDKQIFGVYPTIWLHQNNNPIKHLLDTASPYIVGAYGQMGMLIALLFLIALLIHPQLFFRIVIVFALSVFASLPFWIAYPAITPNETFYSNKLRVEMTESVKLELGSFSPNRRIAWTLQNIAIQRETGKNGYYGITTIPSMHITWSVFILYYGILLYRKFAIYLIPYFILNVFSTIYLLQHFTLDVVAGAVMGAILIFIVGHARADTPKVVIEASRALRLDFESYVVKPLKQIFR